MRRQRDEPTAHGPLLKGDDRALVETLARRAPSETVPLLLELARRRARQRQAADVLRQCLRDPFVWSSALDLRSAHRLDGIALAAASPFEALLLSPLAPLGTCAVMSPASQDRIISTLRSTEVVSDPTNVLALECAIRLRAEPGCHVRLATIHQVVRAQKLTAPSGRSQHFRMLALAEAGRARKDHAFEVEGIVAQLLVLWDVLDRCTELGLRFPRRRLKLLSSGSGDSIAARVQARLSSSLPGLELEAARLESGYYLGVRALLAAETPTGERVFVSDTGLFDWVGKLTSNRSLRFVASGLGLQLLPTLFAPDVLPPRPLPRRR